MLTRFRNLSFLLAYAVATIPLWHYIRDGHILALMVVVVAFTYINIVLSTVQAARPILSSEKSKTPLPRWLPDKPKYHKWWMLVRRTLKWHLLLIPPKMGLALGFVEWLHLGAYQSTATILRPFHYSSPQIPLAYPQWETVTLSIVVLILFTVSECGFISAISMLTSRPSKVVALRLLIALSIVGLMSQYQATIPSRCCYYMRNYQQKLTAIRIDETIETGFLTTTGMGVLLSANIMRPYELSFIRYDHQLIAYRDNRPFVARQIVAGMLGLLLYAGTTWIVLWFVEDDKPPVTN